MVLSSRRSRGVAALLAALLGTVSVGQALDLDLPVRGAAPAFVWGATSGIDIFSQRQRQSIAYEALTPRSVAKAVVDGVFTPAKDLIASSITRLPEVTLVLSGSKLTGTDLSWSDAARPLRAALSAAPYSASIAHVGTEVGSSLAEELVQRLHEQDAVASFHRYGCQSGHVTAEELRTVAGLTPDAGKTKLVVVCADAESAAQEAALMHEACKAVAGATEDYVVVLAAAPPIQVPAQRRSLLAAPMVSAATNMTCGPKCQTQVTLLEAFILTVCLLAALFTGMIMMHALDTPTRFETPKDTTPRE